MYKITRIFAILSLAIVAMATAVSPAIATVIALNHDVICSNGLVCRNIMYSCPANGSITESIANGVDFFKAYVVGADGNCYLQHKPSSLSGGGSIASCNAGYTYNGEDVAFVGNLGNGSITGYSAIPTCKECPAGYSCPQGAMFSNECQPMYYSNAGASTCTRCQNGQYCPNYGTVGPPPPCPAGYYCPNVSGQPADCEISGATFDGSCKCPAGKYCPSGSTAPTDCPPGYYCPSADPTAPIPCPPGKVCFALSSTPGDCSTGTYCPGGGTQPADCVAKTDPYAGSCECPDGHYCPPPNPVAPIPCPTGEHSVDGIHTRCEQCPIGEYSPDAATCAPCTNLPTGGNYQYTTPGTTNQPNSCAYDISCPQNMFVSGGTCVACAAGTESSGGNTTSCTQCANFNVGNEYEPQIDDDTGEILDNCHVAGCATGYKEETIGTDITCEACTNTANAFEIGYNCTISSCDGGFYISGTDDNTSCVACPPLPSGQRYDDGPSYARSPGECTYTNGCSAGTFWDGVACAVCPQNEYSASSSIPGGITEPVDTCNPCPSGTHTEGALSENHAVSATTPVEIAKVCLSNSKPCVNDGTVYWDDITSQWGNCVPSKCPAGQFMNNNECQHCPANMTSDADNSGGYDTCKYTPATQFCDSANNCFTLPGTIQTKNRPQLN